MQFGADFSALIHRFSPESHHPIALAVSGGSDSLALLHLCHAWARGVGRTLLVLTVDHGLRPEAQDEAALVAECCSDLQISHQTLRWTASKPSQNAARRARYRLMAEAMSKAGVKCLLTGHTLDDVIETVFIRRQRGVRGGLSAGPGVAAPIPAWPEGRNMTLLRPLISARRETLRNHLDGLGESWVEDPSNRDMKFERARIRAFFDRHAKLRESILPAITALQLERAKLDNAFAKALASVHVAPDGLIELADHKEQVRLLGVLARVASGRARDPRRKAVAELVESLSAPGMRQTLGGAWVQRTRTGFQIGRDPAEPASASKSIVFDGRFIRDSEADLPAENETAFLVRHARPPGGAWREIISARIEHLRRCYEAAFDLVCVE